MSLQPMMKGSTYLSKTLKGYGLTHVFLMEAIVRQTLVELEALGIRRVVTHSEKAAAYMADGYARAARRPGVCLCQSVGAANLAAGLQDAWLAGSPVLAITGRKPLSHQHRNSYQELDHDPLYDAVTKFNVFAADPADVPRYLRQCFREATTGRPGPVHLDIINHDGGMFDRAQAVFDDIVETRFSHVPAFRPAPAPADVAAAVQKLRKAARPVLVVGNGAAISGAGPEVRKLADGFGIPVSASVDGKGLLPDSHPLCLGPVGDYARTCANDIVKEADLVVYVGCSLSDQLTLSWRLPDSDVGVVQIDIAAAELGRNAPGATCILGDAKLTLAALVEALAGAHAPVAWTQRAGQAVAGWWSDRQAALASEAVPIRTERLCHDLSLAMPENSVLVADTGFSSIWAGAFVRLDRPGQRLIRATGGSLGWSFPASLGVKCALPDSPVFCLTGDGGFWYHLCEMETAARHNIKTITVLNNNGGFGQCRGKVRQLYADKPGRPEDLYQFRPTNFSRLAEEMGCLGLRVERPADVLPTLREALKADRPVLVEVLTDIECDPQKDQ